jgi:death on curing protein
METVFLSLDEVLEIHEQQTERYGGSRGLRDPAGLESAIVTPQATFGGKFLHASIPAMAAAYLSTFARTTRSSTVTNESARMRHHILLMNNWDATFEEEELVDVVQSVASGRLHKQG